MKDATSLIYRITASTLRQLRGKTKTTSIQSAEKPILVWQIRNEHMWLCSSRCEAPKARQHFCSPLLPQRSWVDSVACHIAKTAFSTSPARARVQSSKSSPRKLHKPNISSNGAHVTNKPNVRVFETKDSSARKPLPEASTIKEVSQAKISEILGPVISSKDGNELLRILQKQRITGTLDHGVSGPALNEHLVANALAWLRREYPLDEDAAIIRRIEEEDLQVSQELMAKAERIGLYKPQQSAEVDGIYGKSELEAMRKHNDAEYEKRQAEKAEKAENKHDATDNKVVPQTPKGRAVLTRRTESAEWVQRYKERAQLTNDLEPPIMSIRQRLLPSGLFCLAIIGLSILFAQNYVPPPRQARIFPETPPAAATVLALVSMNVAIFLMWRFAPPLWRFLNTYFILVSGLPKAASLLGNTFSHHNMSHLATNMVGLWFVGTQCE